MRNAGRRSPAPARRGPTGFPLVNASDAATYLRRDHGVRIAPATVRNWARRKRIRTHGLGRDRYDLREVVEYAKARAALETSHMDVTHFESTGDLCNEPDEESDTHGP